MEAVWNELKKIENEAELILSEASLRAEKILKVATKEGERIVANSEIYASEEAQKVWESTVDEANRKRESILKTNDEAIEELKKLAERRMGVAVKAVLDEVRGKRVS